MYPANKKTYIEGQQVGTCIFLKEIEATTKWHRRAIFRCACGNEFRVDIEKLISGHTKSCGCLKTLTNKIACVTHGLYYTPEYNSWIGMKYRCSNKNCKQYKDYGGRGIIVCEEWDKFENFYNDMGKRPSEKHTLDRVSVNGNYCKENCRWATRKEQNSNKRNNVYLEFNGVIKIINDWAKEYNMDRMTLKWRLEKGMSIEEALTTPIDIRFKYKKLKNKNESVL